MNKATLKGGAPQRQHEFTGTAPVLASDAASRFVVDRFAHPS